MKFIDKFFAWFSIPVGGLLLIFGVLGFFQGIRIELQGGFLQALAVAVLGWSLCVSLARSWRATNRCEALEFKEVMKTEEFAAFIAKHPEYEEAPVRTKRKVFLMWRRDRLESLSED